MGEVASAGPDPSWTTLELLAQAEACTSLSAAWLSPLAALRPFDLDPDSRLTLALVLNRMTAVTDALALTALAAVPERTCKPDPALRTGHPAAADRVCAGGSRCGHRWEVEELAALTGLPRWLMDRRRAWAWSLSPQRTGQWAALQPLLAGGQISTEHLRRFDRATTGASAEATAAAVRDIVDAVGGSCDTSADVIARHARRTVARHTSPEDAERRQRTTSREQSGVTFTPLDDGIASLDITGDAHKLEAIRALLHGHPTVTNPRPGDLRTRGQRQVDLLLNLCLNRDLTGLAGPARAPREAGGPGAAATAAADTARGAEPEVGVVITVSLETLIGLSNEPGLVGDTTTSAGLIRRWATDPAWAALAVIDHNGSIASVSRRHRFPAKRLRRTVRARWQRCTYPGCPRPASTTQTDHAEPHALGGDTTLANLHPLCPRHHRFKEQPGVHVQLRPDGAAVWTLPSRRTVTVGAADHRPQPGPWDRPCDIRGWEPPDVDEAPYPDLLEDATDFDYTTWVEHQISRDPLADVA